MTASAFAGNYGLGQQIRLLVARSDWKRAADVLSGLAEAIRAIDWDDASTEEGYWICPQCDEAVEEAVGVCPWCKSTRGAESA
jgi:rubrerythrin